MEEDNNMKFVIQVVSDASVTVDEKLISQIGKGFLILIGIEDADTIEIADKMIKKTSALRIFMDDNGKTNLSIKDVMGEMLLVSQFTLYADCRKGNRPSFVKAGEPNFANEMYEYICKEFNTTYDIPVKKGIFGADMKVALTNDGPFTVVLDSHELFG